MSSNRLLYDGCEYKHRLEASVGPLAYQLDIQKYENTNKCRMELGVTGGNNVSHIKGNLVDLENDLMGLTRPLTQPGQCPSTLYKPQNSNQITLRSRGTNKESVLDTSMVHQKTCNLVDYGSFRYGHSSNIQSNNVSNGNGNGSNNANQCQDCA